MESEKIMLGSCILGWRQLASQDIITSLRSDTTWKINIEPNTLPETNIFAPENGWLKDSFPFGFRPIFRGYVSFRECNGGLVQRIFLFKYIGDCNQEAAGRLAQCDMKVRKRIGDF